MPISAFDIEIIQQIQKLILADLQVHHSIGYLAEKAGMSESRLKQVFKQVAKTSLYACLKQRRMLYAAELLQQNKHSLLLVAKQTGFRHHSNFIRAFKKQTGSTPASYRKQYLNNNKK